MQVTCPGRGGAACGPHPETFGSEAADSKPNQIAFPISKAESNFAQTESERGVVSPQPEFPLHFKCK